MSPLMKATLGLLLCVALCTCSTINELKSSKTATSKTQREGTINVASRATGINSNKLGKTTVLTIPVGSIKARGDTSANIMQTIELALQAAGYNDAQNPAYPAS